MKKTKLFLVLFIIVSLLATPVFATEDTPVTTSDIPDGITTGGETATPEIEEKDRVFTGENITIDALIDGNVVAIGTNVKLTGGIARDLYVIAENFTMDKEAVIYGNLYILASNVTIDGGIYQIYGACDKLELQYYGETQTDLKVMAKEVLIDGVVGRNAYIDADSITIETYGEIRGNLEYTSKAEAMYKETITSEDGESEPQVKTTTEIPADNVKGEKKYEHRDKNLYKSDKEVVKAVRKIVKDTKDMDEEKVQSLIMSKIFSGLGVKVNNEHIKGVAKTLQIPAVVVYIDIAVIILLVVALLLPIIKKNKKTETENK